MIILNAENTRKAELKSTEGNITLLELMENAGKAAAQFMIDNLDINNKNIAIICGKGNNGGDGYVIARHISSCNKNITIILASSEPSTEDSIIMFARSHDIKHIYYKDDKEIAIKCIENADIIIDCIFGIGFKGIPRKPIDEIIETINNSNGIKVSIDVPSGIDCDSGFITDCCVKADYTVTFTTLKPCHVIYPAKDMCGKVHVAQVGIDKSIYEDMSNIQTIDYNYVKHCFKKRKANSNKGDFGKLLSICGSVGMAGAAILAAKSAMHSGVGLVYCAAPEKTADIIASNITEAVMVYLKQNNEGRISSENIERLLKEIKIKSACLIGCGLGNDKDIFEIVSQMISNSKIPLIIDADGINAINLNKDILNKCASDIILTPHPGEMARLCSVTPADIQNHRLEYALSFIKKYNVTLVLKGANTIIASKEGIFINTTGNAGMAKGGSGDILAGMIASFSAQGMSALNAAACGVYLHGLAGDMAAARLSQTAMLPSNMISMLPEIFLQIEKG